MSLSLLKSQHTQHTLKAGPDDHLHARTTPYVPLTRTILQFPALSLCPSVCPNSSNKYDGMWSERREVRKRTATRKEESNKVCAYLRPPHPPRPPTHPPPHLVAPLAQPPGKIFVLDPQKHQEFYTDLGIKFNRRHGYTLLLYLQVSLITCI